MQSTITLSQLITRVATLTGVDNNTARRFLKVFFETISAALEQGQSVTVKNIGTFSPGTEPGANTVLFVPDTEFADDVNKPFRMFEPVELAPDVDFEEVEQEEEEPAAIEEETPEEETPEVPKYEVSEPTPEATVTINYPLYPEEEEEAEAERAQAGQVTAIQEQAVSVVSEISEPVEEEAVEETYEEEEVLEAEKPRRRLWLWAVIAILGVSVIAWLAAVLLNPMPDYGEYDLPDEASDNFAPQIEEVTVEEVPAAPEQQAMPAAAAPASENVAAPEAKPAAAPAPEKAKVYDTVDISLIRLAKKHYGEGNYWVFIYEANSDIISNPNRIRPGTKVLIPDRSSFPGATSEETRRIAKEKQSQILARFK